MAQLKSNIVAGYLASSCVALTGLLFVPILFDEFGAAGFGFVTLLLGAQSLSLALDLGISTFVSREVARRTNQSERAPLASLAVTFDKFAWCISAILALALYFAAGLLSPGVSAAPDQPVEAALLLIGFSVAAIWPNGVYSAMLAGLERVSTVHLLAAIFATVRFAGGYGFVWLVNGGVINFLAWQVGVSLLHSVVARAIAFRQLDAPVGSAQFAITELLNARRFASGAMLVTSLGVALSQLDRVVVAGILDIEAVGLFGITAAVAGGLGRIISPVFGAVYPRMSRLVVEQRAQEMRSLYHLSTQLVALATLSIAAVVCSQPAHILLLWTGSEHSPGTAACLALLIAGSAFNGILSIPYALQLAHGWTRLAIGLNILALAVAIPAYTISTANFGIAGAAATWLVLNVALTLFGVRMMHTRLLPGELIPWWRRSLGPPMAAAMCVGALLAILSPPPERSVAGVAWLAGSSVFSLVLVSLATPLARDELTRRLRGRRFF